MPSQILIGDLPVDLVLKDVRNVRLSVHPPEGRVRISAPRHMSLSRIRAFANSRLDWIRSQQERIRAKPLEAPRGYVDGESHFVWGRRYLLAVVEAEGPPAIELTEQRMLLQVPPGAGAELREALVEAWSRDRLREAVVPLLSRWEPVLGVRVRAFHVRRMKTKWGSCSHRVGTIRLNSELVRKPPECLEYVVVHELMHLLEPTHNPRFQGLMDRHLPWWRERRTQLRGSGAAAPGNTEQAGTCKQPPGAL